MARPKDPARRTAAGTQQQVHAVVKSTSATAAMRIMAAVRRGR
jgi:hypothetical protein